MLYSKKIIKLTIILFYSVLLVSCAVHQQKPIAIPSDIFFDFETAIRLLTNNLLLQAENLQIRQNELENDSKNILINPFVYAATNQSIILHTGTKDQAKTEMQAIGKSVYELIQEAKKYPTTICNRKLCRRNEVIPFSSENTTFNKFTNFSIQNIQDIESEHLNTDYIMYGVVSPKRFVKADGEEIKYFLLDVTIKDANNNLSIARKQIKINDEIHIGNYKGKFNKLPKELAYLISINKESNKEFPTISSDARLKKARDLYQQGDFKTAELLYEELIDQGTERDVYQELYRIYLLTDRKEKADNILFKMLQFLVENDDKRLGVLYFFMPASTIPMELDDNNLISYVNSWFVQLEKLLVENNNYCLNVLGHSSYSGSDKSNLEVSLQRAEEIARRITEQYPNITNIKTWGEGYHKCCNCSGMDDNFDIEDRRVEFKVTLDGCPETVPEYITACSEYKNDDN